MPESGPPPPPRPSPPPDPAPICPMCGAWEPGQRRNYREGATVRAYCSCPEEIAHSDYLPCPDAFHGKPWPSARPSPAPARERGGRLRLWLPPEVFDRVERAARAGGVSVGEWVRGVIVAALGR